jgi:cholesterol transport system auxiliary component
MKRRPFNLGCAAFLLCALFSGCVSLERSYPDKHYFVLATSHNEKSSDQTENGVLEVSSIGISPRYESQSFVYRISDAGYESDFYNQFLIPPAALITEEVRKALVQSRVFEHVINSSSQLPPTYTLEGTINTLYGDFRSNHPAAAVLEIEFFLSKPSPAGTDILMDKRYSKSVPVSGRSPEALVKGWDEALGTILAGLITDLKSVNKQR